jgi:hypothetical protein
MLLIQTFGPTIALLEKISELIVPTAPGRVQME